jgi:rhodanese-related sulfurtransferase
LLERFERVGVKRGDVVLREGAVGDYYYLIERGRSVVTRLVGGVDMEIAALKPGDAFGEEALLADSTRNATVTMKTDGALLRLSKLDFFELLREPLLKRVAWTAAVDLVANGAKWIDVRFPAEFVQDGLPGALNIPLNEVRRSVSMLDTECEYVAYCQSGRRSSAAAFLLSQRGLRASALAGGLMARPATLRETVKQ